MQNSQKTVIPSAIAGIAGVAAGAALGAALSNTKTRKKITNTLKNVQKQGMEKLNMVKKAARRFGEQTQATVEKGKKSTQKSLKGATAV